MRKLLCILISLTPFFAYAEDASPFRWARQIDLPVIRETSLVSIPLDPHVFEHTRPGHPDLQLWSGGPQGYVVRKATESKNRSVRSFWGAEQGPVKVDSDRELTVEFSLREKAPIPQGIRIVTPLRDIERQVFVESSADGNSWVSAGPPTLIFDYSRYINARNDLVPISANSHRKFRLTVHDLTAEQESQLLELHRKLTGEEETNRTERTVITRRPFRIDRIEFYHDEQKIETGKPEQVHYPITDFEVREDEKRHETMVTIPTQRQPVTQIKILTDSENFSRGVTIETEQDNGPDARAWRSFAKGVLTRFSIGTIQKEETTLEFAETISPRYRVAIKNHDSESLRIVGVEISGPKYQLIFLASPKPDTVARLDYGADNFKSRHYDTAALDVALAQHLPVQSGTLQSPVENTAAPLPVGNLWNDTRVLVGIILALVGLLTWGLYKASSKMEPPTPN